MKGKAFQFAVLLGQQVMIISDMTEIWKFEIVQANRKFLINQLPYERIYNRETLTGTGSADHHRATKNVADINPAVSNFPLVIEKHGDVNRIMRIHPLDRLHKAFGFGVPF